MSRGKRAGARKGARAGRTPSPAVLALAAAITLAVIAWGLLVFTAIRFGVSARDGEDGAWLWLAVATTGAMACLFVGMLLVTRLGRALGITTPPAGSGHTEAAPPDPAAPPTEDGPAGGAPAHEAAGSASANPYLDRLVENPRQAASPPAHRSPGGHRA